MILDFLDERIEDSILDPVEKISWKKELYFVRYSISNFGDFSDFEHISKNFTLIFKVEIYKNVTLTLEVESLQECPSDFLS